MERYREERLRSFSVVCGVRYEAMDTNCNVGSFDEFIAMRVMKH